MLKGMGVRVPPSPPGVSIGRTEGISPAVIFCGGGRGLDLKSGIIYEDRTGLVKNETK